MSQPKVRRIDPHSERGLGGTYHAQADLGQTYGSGYNKYNWACAFCGTVYLNRWKAEQCYSSHAETQTQREDPFKKSMEHIEGNEWCMHEECLKTKHSHCHNSPDGLHHFVGAAMTHKYCEYCLLIWNTAIHEMLVVRRLAFRSWKFVGEK